MCGPLWDAEPQPWYFGASLDLGCLGVSFKASEEALPMAMDCGSEGAAAGCGGGDDDEIPLLTLDLGGGQGSSCACTVCQHGCQPASFACY